MTRIIAPTPRPTGPVPTETTIMTTNRATPMGMTTRSGTRLTRPITFSDGPLPSLTATTHPVHGPRRWPRRQPLPH